MWCCTKCKYNLEQCTSHVRVAVLPHPEQKPSDSHCLDPMWNWTLPNSLRSNFCFVRNGHLVWVWFKSCFTISWYHFLTQSSTFCSSETGTPTLLGYHVYELYLGIASKKPGPNITPKYIPNVVVWGPKARNKNTQKQMPGRHGNVPTYLHIYSI